MKLQDFDSNCSCDKSNFEDGGTQNYWELQLVLMYSKKIANSNHILVWKSKGLYDECIKPLAASNHSLAPALN